MALDTYYDTKVFIFIQAYYAWSINNIIMSLSEMSFRYG